jgi:hypothetical protein
MSSAIGWLQDHKSEDVFRNEMIENQYSYFDECDRYMVSTAEINGLSWRV